MRPQRVVLHLCLSAACITALGAAFSCAQPRADAPVSGRVTLDVPTDLPGLENVLELRPGLISGGEPRGDAGYASLRSLGIKTVVSMDAVAPDATRSGADGIRVVHLPIGYEGVSEQRAAQLAAAVRDLPRPIYVHCHHGKHRGPAALCVGAIGAGLISHAEAVSFMERAGTSPSYHGLWRDTDSASPLDDADLAGLARALPATDVPEGTAGAMALIDRAHERLWLVHDNGWSVPEDHPDLAPASDAGLIHNLLRSLTDSEEIDVHGQAYAAMLEEATDYAASLEQAIRSGDHTGSTDSLNLLLDSCVDCHSGYQD